MTAGIRDLIAQAQWAFLITHVDPDGDAVGSTLAMGRALHSMGKRCSLACADPIPQTLSFLPGFEEFATPEITGEDLIVAVDDSDPTRFGKPYEHLPSLNIPIVNIDHHITNTAFGTVNVVRTDAAATAEIVFELLHDWGVPLDPQLASCLLTGVVTDTQSFTTSNTTPNSLEIAAKLMRAGGSLTQINEHVYKNRKLATLRLWGKVLDLSRLDGNVVWSVSSLAMQNECGTHYDDGDGVVNLLATASEAKAAIVFKERDDGQIEISIRSRPGVDISPIAIGFGGGGHPQAAGTTLTGPLEQIVPRVLAKARQVLT
jgi:phosphoesterase RecJ-like protein